MGNRARHAVVAVVLTTTGCGGSATPTVTVATTNAAQEPAGPETDHERKRRLASAKREQCLALGIAIQQAQRQDLILNVNDEVALEREAQSLDASARTIAAVHGELPEFRAVRDDYQANLRAMAGALRGAARAKSERERKPSIDEFHRREEQSGTIIERINDYCNAPVE